MVSDNVFCVSLKIVNLFTNMPLKFNIHIEDELFCDNMGNDISFIYAKKSATK